MVLVENDTRFTNYVLFKQTINIFILGIKKMKFCCRISDGIKTHSHGNTRNRNSLVNKVNMNVFVKFIHVFNSLNHRNHI